MKLDSSLNVVIDRLTFNAKTPKFQLERAIEVFLSIFLEEFLSEKLNDELKIIVQEFPLKKSSNNQSTNVDYLMHGKNFGNVLVELKTNETLREKQVEVYIDISTKSVKSHIDEIKKISEASKNKKYHHLLSTLNNSDIDIGDQPLPVIFITPHKQKPKAIGDFMWFSLAELFNDFESINHPELWSKVKQLKSVVCNT